jgi:hypothetical protein
VVVGAGCHIENAERPSVGDKDVGVVGDASTDSLISTLAFESMERFAYPTAHAPISILPAPAITS